MEHVLCCVVLCFKRQVVKFQITVPDEPAPTNRRRRTGAGVLHVSAFIPPSQSSGLVNRGASRTLAHRPLLMTPCHPRTCASAPACRHRCRGPRACTRACPQKSRTTAGCQGARRQGAQRQGAPLSSRTRACRIPLSCQTHLLRPSAKSHRWAGNVTRGASRC